MKKKKELTKRQKQLLVVGVFLFLGVMLQMQQSKDQAPVLIRGDPGSGESTEELTFQIKDATEEETVSVEVPEQKLTKKQAEKLLKNAEKEMEASFLEKGQTLSHITKAVHMKESYADGLVSAEWDMEPLEEADKEQSDTKNTDTASVEEEMEEHPEKWQDVVVEEQIHEESAPDPIDEDGKLQDDAIPKDGMKMAFCVRLRYANYSLRHSFQGTLYQRPLSKTEQLLQAVQQAVSSQIEEKQEEKEISLPTTVDQKKVEWKKGKSLPYLIVLPVLGILLAVMLEWKEKQDIVEQRKKTTIQLERDYPDFVSKMAVLLGAGMNMDAVFKRLGETYRLQRKHGASEYHEVYEQVLVATQELQEGIGEVRVYERFGERCQTPEYRRLCSYISQNLRKGTKALAAMLEKESEEALHKRRQMVQKVAEEAGNKLLFPMLLMLLDIMVILMAGVFLQM
ncbi:MAG: type II secretion system F family protein [Lachnospiraceae bacterium]